MSQINTQIDLETTDKLTYIQQQTNQDLPAILRAAIDDYYLSCPQISFALSALRLDD
jgi:hypothetical protein